MDVEDCDDRTSRDRRCLPGRFQEAALFAQYRRRTLTFTASHRGASSRRTSLNRCATRCSDVPQQRSPSSLSKRPPPLASQSPASYGEMSRRSGLDAYVDNHSDISTCLRSAGYRRVLSQQTRIDSRMGHSINADELRAAVGRPKTSTSQCSMHSRCCCRRSARTLQNSEHSNAGISPAERLYLTGAVICGFRGDLWRARTGGRRWARCPDRRTAASTFAGPQPGSVLLQHCGPIMRVR
jgi:hypothetical protein